MSIHQFINNQGLKEVSYEEGLKRFEFERGIDTFKIDVFEGNDLKQIRLIKGRLWNEYYSRILLYKNSQNKFLIWSNNQFPEKEGQNFDFNEKNFNEKVSPMEYWGKYISKTSKNTVDKILEENILILFRNLKEKKYTDDDAITIILACTFIRFLEDRNLSDIKDRLIDSLQSKNDVIKLFKKYNALHNGMLFKNKILYKIDENICKLLLDFLKNKLNVQQGLFEFNFKYIPVELISSVYEKLLTEKLGNLKKKNQGIAYTPPRFANYVVNNAFKQLEKKYEDFLKIKIADLSVGSGIFLVLCFRKLLKKINKNNEKSFDEKVQLLKNSLYGADLDESAKNITIFSLYVELFENENKKLSKNNKFPILNDNIKKIDTLLSLNENNFFDLVIGNPPWKSKDDVSFLKIKNRKFVSDICNKELSQIFTQISLEKLKDGGILSLILPTAIFYNASSFKFRNSILNKTIVKSFVDFSALRSILFKNNVESSVLIAEKNSDKFKKNYVIPFNRALNKADYLYFNHVSGEVNYINSNFLKFRNDSWQIATRGGNTVAKFIERLNTEFICLSDINKEKIQIGTGYQSVSKGKNKTISTEYSNEFFMPIYVVKNGEILKMFTNLKKFTNKHIEFNKNFYKQCIGVGNSYKYTKGFVFDYFSADNNRVLSGDFNIIASSDKNLLFFLLGFLTSRLSEFFISISGSKTGLLSSEVANPKIQSIDIKRIVIPKNYLKFEKIIEIGKKISEKKDFDINFVNMEIEKIYKLNNFEKQILEKWEVITNRKEKGTGTDVFKKYQTGFEKMLTDFNLEKPRKWSVNEKHGVQIISFTGDNKFASIKDINSEIFNEVVTAKENFNYKFMTNDRCLILRRKDNNFGYMTGLSDAEYILSNL